MPESDIYKAYPKTLTSPIDVPQEDETVPAFRFFRRNPGVELLACLSGKGELSSSFKFAIRGFKTAAGVGVGSSLKDLRLSQQITSIDGGETGGDWAAVESLRMSFELQLDDQMRTMLGQRVSNGKPYTGDVDPHIPDDTNHAHNRKSKARDYLKSNRRPGEGFFGGG